MSNNSKEYRERTYEKYRKNAQYMRDQVMRVTARRKALKEWKVKSWDWKEVDHIRWVKYWNWKSNIRILTMLQNRRLGQKKATKSQLANNKK